MGKEQYIVEREYRGAISVKEIMCRIIKKHSDNYYEYKKSDYVKTAKEPQQVNAS